MENKIALLIDCDNISFKTIDSIIKELDTYGEIIIKRAYGNWRSDNLKNWLQKLTELSIKPIHQIDYTKGKNASDMAIVIDAMDMMHLKKVNSFAIVSSDSDFTPLTMKLLEEGFKVYGFGTKQTPSSLKNSCSVFTDILSLSENTTNEKTIDPKIQLKENILQIFNQQSPNNESITMEKFNQKLKENHIDFHRYGFKQLKVFIDSLDLFHILINDKNQGFIQLKSMPWKETKIRWPKANIIADKELMKNFTSSYEDLAKKQKEVHLSTYFNYLSINHNFTHKTYGYSTFKDFMLEIDIFDFISKDGQPFIIKK